MYLRIDPAVPISPAEEVCNGWALGKIGIEHPVNDERCILIGCVLGADDERPEEVGAVLICAYDDGI